MAIVGLFATSNDNNKTLLFDIKPNDIKAIYLANVKQKQQINNHDTFIGVYPIYSIGNIEMVLKKAPNGYSISSDAELNGKLEVMKRMLGARNYAQIIKTMLLCPDIDSFLFDRFRDTCLLEGKEQYIKTHQVEPSGTYRMTYVKLPKSGRVVIDNA